jgi:hypothetical protein
VPRCLLQSRAAGLGAIKELTAQLRLVTTQRILTSRALSSSIAWETPTSASLALTASLMMWAWRFQWEQLAEHFGTQSRAQGARLKGNDCMAVLQARADFAFGARFRAFVIPSISREEQRAAAWWRLCCVGWPFFCLRLHVCAPQGKGRPVERHCLGLLHRRYAGRPQRFVQPLASIFLTNLLPRLPDSLISGPRAAAFSGLFGGVFLAVIEGINIGLQKYMSPNSQMQQVSFFPVHISRNVDCHADVQEQIRMVREQQERMQAEGISPPEPSWWQKMLMGDQMQQPQPQPESENFASDFDDE